MSWRTIVCLFFCLMFLSATASGRPTSVSDQGDQTEVKVTVYNDNLGLIKEIRKLTLPDGEGELRFMDVPAHIMPPTVHARSLNHPDGFNVLEQNYEYDLMNAEKLLDKYVGKKVKLIVWNKYQDRKEVVEATLLSNNQGQIYRINDEIYLGHPGYRVLPKLPENLIAKPTLTWLYRSGGKETHDLEVSYLTKNMNWRADYVIVLEADDRSADLSGWVTLDNQSGATYKNARLKLVAGKVHQVREERMDRAFKMEAAIAAKAAPQFKEEAFFEYHLYDLQRPTTVKDRQTKQINLIEVSGVGTEKELRVYGIQTYYTRQYRGPLPKQPVDVYIKFKNSKPNQLGMPLPGGIMRLYKRDQDGSQQFVGEDRIDHTPKDEEVMLKIGEAFDVVAERVQTDYKRLTTRLYETEWEITLRNHKEEDVTVGVVEPLFGNWKIIGHNLPYKKMDAFTIRFDAEVPKDEEVKIKYRVQVGL